LHDLFLEKGFCSAKFLDSLLTTGTVNALNSMRIK
jgi:hypothetical protein